MQAACNFTPAPLFFLSFFFFAGKERFYKLLTEKLQSQKSTARHKLGSDYL